MFRREQSVLLVLHEMLVPIVTVMLASYDVGYHVCWLGGMLVTILVN